MLPGLGGMNPSQMKSMMRQMGIKSEELEAERVIIELRGGKRLVFDDPQVTGIDMKGQTTYTLAGTPREEGAEGKIPQEDVEMVASQAGASAEDAEKALTETRGDIAEAIAKLKKE